MGKKVLATLALTGAMIAIPASAAFAHDCFIANRSANGAVGAGHSAGATGFDHGWVTIDLAEELENSGVKDVDAAIAEWVATGHPAFVATRVDKLIGEGSSNPNIADGGGLEYFSESTFFGDFAELVIKHGGTL